MAKDAHDREDLLRDASAFAVRIEFEFGNSNSTPTNVFCGFRDNGALSVYWDQDTVLQFNTRGELRRAYWQERMVATYKHQPHWLESDSSGRVRLRRIEFTPNETQQFRTESTSLLLQLGDSINHDPIVVGQVPEDANVKDKVQEWLSANATLKFAMHPGVGK